MPNALEAFLKHAFEELGLSYEDAMRMSPSEYRDVVAEKKGKAIRYVSSFPNCGRGSVHHDFVTPEELEERTRLCLANHD